MPYRSSSAAFFRRASLASGKALRLQTLSLHVERLEDRRVMNADDPLASSPAANDSAETVQTAPNDAAAADAAPATFQSRQELRQWLIELADLQWGSLFGQRHAGWGRWPSTWLTLDGNLAATRFMAMDLAAADTTNVQVAGVDEADLVETDGEHLYIISGQDLVIVRAGVGEELEILSRVRLDQKITGMYLDGDRLALVSTNGSQYSHGDSLRIMPMIFLTGEVVEVELDDSQMADSHRRGPTTTVTLLDVSDRTAPALVKKTEFDGRLVDSRTVDGQLRLVIANDFNLPSPNSRPVESENGEPANELGRRPAPPWSRPIVLDGDVVTTGFWIGDDYPHGGTEYEYETRDEYIERVIDALLDNLPSVRDVGLDGEAASEAKLVTPEGIFRPDRKELGTLTTVATIDMHGSGAVVDKASVIASAQATVYGTKSSLYLLTQAGGWSFGIGGNGYEGPKTNIWKFDFDAETHGIELAARGRVDGTILNQFAVDEHDGRLRVVTTGNLAGDQKLLVLEQSGKQLEVVGSVGGLAPGESLYSVRFMGDVAFAVTFRQVDPLFVIDLSDPTAPAVVGELKIPGYSDHLQMLDDGRLMGIGRGADERTGLFEELQVSIFDVSDLSNPTLVDRYSFGGGRSTATQATGDRWTRGDGDHLAVSYFAAAGLVAVPVFTETVGTWWGDAEEPLFKPGEGGLQLFRIGAGGELVPVALIEHDDLIHRSLVVGGNLFALSDGAVTVHSLDDPAGQLGKLELGVGESDLTPLRAWTAAEEAIGVAPERVGIPIDAFAGSPQEAAMGPAPAGPAEWNEAARTASVVETAPEEADAGGAPVDEESNAAVRVAEDDGETPLALEVRGAELEAPFPAVREAVSAATVGEATAQPAAGRSGVGWLALGTTAARGELKSDAALRDRDRDRSESVAPSAPDVQFAATAAAWQDFDLRSLDAVFGDEAEPGFDAWDETWERPGLGPLLA